MPRSSAAAANCSAEGSVKRKGDVVSEKVSMRSAKPAPGMCPCAQAAYPLSMMRPLDDGSGRKNTVLSRMRRFGSCRCSASHDVSTRGAGSFSIVIVVLSYLSRFSFYIYAFYHLVVQPTASVSPRVQLCCLELIMLINLLDYHTTKKEPRQQRVLLFKVARSSLIEVANRG